MKRSNAELRQRKSRKIAAFFLLVSACWLAPMYALLASPTAAPRVDRVVLRDTIQPVSAARIERAITVANREHAALLLVELDTPGGLLDSTREIVGAMLSSQVPIAVYIAPAGARAGSAGFFLLEAADVAAMAPGTNAGASHPVLETGTPDDTMKQKMENDAAAFLRSYTARRGRNVEAAEQAVRSSKSYSAEEALDAHLIDVIAANDKALLSALDGREITRMDGTKQRLDLKNAQIVTLDPTVRERILGALANPNLALLILVAGALLIYLEFHIPGTIVPGATGTVMVLLALFALDMLPIRHTALLLLLAAAALLLLEVKFSSHGVLALAGIACLSLGALTLVDAPIPELRIEPAVAIALSAAFGAITVFLLRLAVRAKRRKSLLGPAALVGYPALAMEPLTTAADADGRCGRVQVQGEIWEALAAEPLPVASKVRVTGIVGDRLIVERLLPSD